MARKLLFRLIAGWLGILLLFVAYWLALLLVNRFGGFIPNADKRIAMYKFSLRNPKQKGPWIPQQGGYWIF